MSADLRVRAEVDVNGQAAAAELKRVAGAVGEAKVAVQESNATSTQAAAALRTFRQSGQECATTLERLRAEAAAANAAQALANAQFARASAELQPMDRANRGAAESANANRQGMAGLGMQLNDVAVQAQSGTSAFTIFAQQGTQVAFALSQMTGAAGKFGNFLMGPWGTALTVGAIAVGILVQKLDDSATSSKAAEAAMKKFADRQDDLSNFIDRTTGKLVEQNRILVRNAVLTRENKIEENNKAIREATNKAATDLLNAGPTTRNRDFVRERGPGTLDNDPALRQVVKAARNADNTIDADRLFAGIERVVKLRPELKATADAITATLGPAILLKRENDSLAEGVRQLNGATRGQVRVSRELVDAQVALQTATTPLERAQARLALVRLQGAAAEKAGGKALEEYRANVTAAQLAVNAAEKAQQDGRAATREHNKELREQQAELKRQERAWEDVAEAVSRYIDRVSQAFTSQRPMVEELERIGRDLRAPLEAEQASIDKRPREAGVRPLDAIVADANRRSAAASEAGEKIAVAWADTAMGKADAIGRALGGAAGDAISNAAQEIGRFVANDAEIRKMFQGAPKGSTLAAFGEGYGMTRDGTSQALESVGRGLNKISEGLGPKFAKEAGKAFAGASVGATVAGVADAVGIKLNKTGAQIGGALGGLTGIPGGDIIGAIAGGLIGNAFAKSGSATISASNGKVANSSSGNGGIAKAASALTGSIGDAITSIAQQLGGEIGNFSVSIGKRGSSFRVDTAGGGRIRGNTVTAFDNEGDAVRAALADAIKDGAIGGVSPRVQGVLKQYADNVNRALAEALKVKGLEDLLADRGNPFASAFRQLEAQLKERVKVASEYGFDLVQIEKINAEDRAAALKEALTRSTGSIKALLADLMSGGRATGSATERLGRLTAERAKAADLARGGDTSQIDVVANLSQQIDDLAKEAFGTTGAFASSRQDTIALLNGLVSFTEDRIKAGAADAQKGTDALLAEAKGTNAALEDIYGVNKAMLEALQAMGFSNGGGGGGTEGLLGMYARSS